MGVCICEVISNLILSGKGRSQWEFNICVNTWMKWISKPCCYLGEQCFGRENISHDQGIENRPVGLGVGYVVDEIKKHTHTQNK